MKVFLTGSSGVMGRSAITALRGEGHEIVALVRSQSTFDLMRSMDIEPRFGDVFDFESLRSGMATCDAVANLATKVPVGATALRPHSWKTNDLIRTRASRVVAEAAQSAGIQRIVQQSLSMIYADNGDEWIDEQCPVDITRATEPIVVAESHLERFTTAGAVGVSLRFGQITGEHGLSSYFLSRARAGKFVGIGTREGWTHVVHPDDVGHAVAAALHVPSGVYNVGAEPIRRGALADLYAQAAGREHGKLAPRWVQRIGGVKLESMTRSQRVSSQRFIDISSWEPKHASVTVDWFDELR